MACLQGALSMDPKHIYFQEFRDRWHLSEDLIFEATKDDLVEVARILAMQVTHFARKHGELPLSDLHQLLSSSYADDQITELLRDGTNVFVEVLAMVTGAAIKTSKSRFRKFSPD